MSRLLVVLSFIHEDQRGQIAIIVAGGMVAFLGLAALAIDLGFFAENRRDSRNDADAMALAGVQELAVRGLTQTDRETNATDEAETWAGLNDVDPSEIVSVTFGATCSGDAIVDTITVRLQKTQNTFLAGILGQESGEINACATARTGQARGGLGLLPIGLLYADPGVAGDICYYDDGTGNAHSNFYYDPSDGGDLSDALGTYAPGGEDESCVIKIKNPNAGDAWASGNTGPIRLDEICCVDPTNYQPDCDPDDTNSGMNEYRANLEDGGDCAYSVGDRVRPFTGGGGSNTCETFEDRFAGHGDEDGAHAAHTLTDVFTDPVMIGGNPVYTKVDITNPHFGLIPVITKQGSGSSEWVEFVKFVTVYLTECVETGTGTNTLYTVTVIPVNSQFFAPGQEIVEPGDADFSEDWPAYTVKLIE